METLREVFFGSDSFGTGPCCCYDSQYRMIRHGTEQRYISPTTGKCKPLIVQAVHPRSRNNNWTEVQISAKIPDSRKLAIWLVVHPPSSPHEIIPWLFRWVWFTLALIWPFNVPWYTGFYPPYLSKYYGQLWAARSPQEHSLLRVELEKNGAPIPAITHGTCPRRLLIFNPVSESWDKCSDEKIIRQQSYVAISYPYDQNILGGIAEEHRLSRETAFVEKAKAAVLSLGESALWIDLELIEETSSPEEVSLDLYRMADVYRGAKFTLIMLCPPDEITEGESWLGYGERLWTFPEALLSRELRFKFRDGNIMPITLHHLANRAYAGFAQESAIINAYALRDPLERLERLSLLKSALWRRTSNNLQNTAATPDSQAFFKAYKVYALMGFFDHRIHPYARETELQALVRLSMANDNDRLVERMVSLLPSQIPDAASWYAEDDGWRANLWDIEPEIQVVGMTESHALILGGCRAAAIRWKDFPTVAFAVQSVGRLIANYLPNVFWELLIIGITLEASFGPNGPPGAAVPLIVALILMLFAPLLVAYGTSGRTVRAQPWLVGVKGLISDKQTSTHLYGGSIFTLPKTRYSPSGTLLSETAKGRFRCGDPAQLEALRTGRGETDDLYTLVDTLSATIYYFRAARPPTVCLYTGRESGMGRFLLCSERCTSNELHKEAVIRMPWNISQSMPACDWVALG